MSGSATNDLNRRLAVTVFAVGLILAGLNVSPWGLKALLSGETVFDPTKGLPNLSLFPIGLVDFVCAFVLLELVALLIPSLRARRVGTRQERKPLTLASLILGGILAVVHSGLLIMNSWQSGATEFSSEVIVAIGMLVFQLVVAQLLLLGLAYWVTWRGIANGFAVVALLVAFKPVGSWFTRFGPELIAGPIKIEAKLFLLAWLFFGVVMAWHFMRLARPIGDLPVSARHPFLASGLAPLVLVAPLVLKLFIFVNVFLTGGAPYSSLGDVVYIVHNVAILNAVLLFGFLFFRPVEIARLWKRWVPTVDDIVVVAIARAQLPLALGRAGVMLVVFPAFFVGINSKIFITVAATLSECVLLTVVLQDWLEEWRFRRQQGHCATVREVQRVAEVEPICFVLRQAGIDFHARSFGFRSLLQFFGPFAPVEILVPSARAEDAGRLLESR